MNKQIISNLQAICMMIMFLIGNSLIHGVISTARQDVWIAVILAFFMSLPILFIYSRLLSLFPDKDLYDIIQEVFGNILGKIISILFTWYFFHLGALVIRNFSEFVNVISFPETPQFITIIFFGLLCIWVTKAGVEVLARWSVLVFPTLFLIMIMIDIFSINKIHLVYIKPVLYNGIKPVLTGAFSMCAFPFAETVVFTTVLNSLKYKNKTFKVYFISILISSGILLLSSIRNLLILGPKFATSIYFPSYIAVRIINISDFIERFEVLIAIIYMLASFVKVSICLYAASKGFARVLSVERFEQIVAPIGLLMMNLASILYKNTMEMFDFAENTYKYYALPFEVILPIVLLLVSSMRRKTAKH